MLTPLEKLPHVLTDPRRCGLALRLGHCDGPVPETDFSLLTKQLRMSRAFFFSGLDNEIAMRVAFGDSGITESVGVE